MFRPSVLLSFQRAECRRTACPYRSSVRTAGHLAGWRGRERGRGPAAPLVSLPARETSVPALCLRCRCFTGTAAGGKVPPGTEFLHWHRCTCWPGIVPRLRAPRAPPSMQYGGPLIPIKSCFPGTDVKNVHKWLPGHDVASANQNEPNMRHAGDKCSLMDFLSFINVKE